MASLSDTMPPMSVASQTMWGYAKAGGSALVLGAAFGGGLLFGGGDDEEVAEEQPALVAADASTDKLEAVQAKLRLGFHDELTGPPRDKPEGPAITPGAAKAVVPAAVPSRAEEASSGTEPSEAAAVVVEKPAPVAAVENGAAPDEDEEMIAAPPRAETEDDRTRVARALAKVLGPDAAAPAVIAQAKQMESSFAVQVASTPSEEGANALVEKLRGQGHAASVVQVDLEGKGSMYRVRVGGLSSRDAASAYREKLGEGFVIQE